MGEVMERGCCEQRLGVEMGAAGAAGGRKLKACLWALVAMGLGLPAAGAATRVPHLDARGQAGYQDYARSEGHKAFAIAPGGAWAWHGEQPNPEMAAEAALRDCRSYGEQRCFIYAQDERVVLDVREWSQGWGPYAGRAEAARAASGLRRGQRFPDLRWTHPDGKAGKLSDLRGKVVVVHFWGSWCPPCQREMPDLAKFAARFAGARDVAFVLLPVRESLETARSWLRSRGLALPLYDGGADAAKSGEFQLAGGGRLRDRDLARAFPTTYVLDRHGLVVFSHVGPLPDWSEYAPFLRDVAARSGR